MARERIYGSDTEFCAWMRNCKDLPAYSDDCGFVATDNDVTIHRYMFGVGDAVGTRDIQAVMELEVKTRGGKCGAIPTKSQEDTLLKKHLLMSRRTSYGEQLIWGFGVSFLRLENTTPDNSEYMHWGRFNRNAVIQWHTIDVGMLLKLMRFEVKPEYPFVARPFRRHHKTSQIVVREISELGFEYERLVTTRS